MKTRSYLLPILLLALAQSALPQANSVVVLPGMTAVTDPSAAVIGADTLTTTKSFVSAVNGIGVFAKPTLTASDVKYYVVSASGSNTLIVLDSTFTPRGLGFSLGQNATAAAMTPNGARMLVLAGTLRVFDTTTDAEVLPQVQVGSSPNDVAVSLDSRRAFVASASSQTVTAVDLATNAVLGTIAVPGTLGSAVAVGPNGLLYISAQNRVFEVDAMRTPFDQSSVRRTFDVNGIPGKLAFTPDGTRAVAVNTQPATGIAAWVISLHYTSPYIARVLNTTDPKLTGVALDKLVVSGNTRAFAVSATRKLFEITLPLAPAGGGAMTDPSIREAYFGSLAEIPVVDSVAVSNEYPEAASLYVSAPLKTVQPLAQDYLYRISLTTMGLTGQIALSTTPGRVSFVGPAPTAAAFPPSGTQPYNMDQPSLSTSARSLPLVVRVIGGNKPLFGVSVTFSSTSAGVTFEGVNPAVTNAEGLASIVVVASQSGLVSVTATIAGSGLTNSFTLGVGSGSTTGGGTGAITMTMVSGNGQVIREGSLTNRFVVQIKDPAGMPVVGATVVWTLGTGLGYLTDGYYSDVAAVTRTTLTDSEGKASNALLTYSNISFGASFTQTTVTASYGGLTATFYVTAIPVTDPNGNAAPLPSVTVIAPTDRLISGKSGQILAGAIQVRVTSASLPGLGQAIPNVGVTPSTGLLPTAGPVASCSPEVTALTDGTGVANCNLLLGGRAGEAILTVDIGGFSSPTFILRVAQGDPAGVKIVRGDQQSGRAGEAIPTALVVEVVDSAGTPLTNVPVEWSIIAGNAELIETNRATDARGQVSTRVRLGATPGTVQVRVRALAGNQPSATFTLTTLVTLSQLLKISGDGQTSITGRAFGAPLVVQANDDRGAPVPGVQISFSLAGPGILSSPTAVTDTQGRASVTVTAGSTAGTITVSAGVTPVTPVSFTLRVIPPGPVVQSSGFINAASGFPGVVPGGLVTIVGTGLATDLQGVYTANPSFGPLRGHLPEFFQGVQVLFGGIAAPIFQVANVNNVESVTVQAPFELPAGITSVEIRVRGGSATIGNVQVFPYQPGVFETTDGLGRRYAVLLKSDGSYVSPDNPALRGETIYAYITGAGQVDPIGVTNRPGTGEQRVLAPVVVGVGGEGVRVISATYAEGMIGVYVIAFEVPASAPVGTNVPFAVAVDAGAGQLVFGNGSTLAIR